MRIAHHKTIPTHSKLISTAKFALINTTYARIKKIPHRRERTYPFIGTTTSVVISNINSPTVLVISVGVKWRS